jgi:putative glutathione S-transferase
VPQKSKPTRSTHPLTPQIYPSVNNGVYRCGFATTQPAYDAASSELHAALARVDDILSRSRFLTGERCAGGRWNV